MHDTGSSKPYTLKALCWCCQATYQYLCTPTSSWWWTTVEAMFASRQQPCPPVSQPLTYMTNCSTGASSRALCIRLAAKAPCAELVAPSNLALAAPKSRPAGVSGPGVAPAPNPSWGLATYQACIAPSQTCLFHAAIAWEQRFCGKLPLLTLPRARAEALRWCVARPAPTASVAVTIS